MEFPKNLRYTKEHEWVHVEGDVAMVGITDYAQSELGDVVFVELPAKGRTLKASETFGVVESVKSVSDLYAPVSGEILDVNGTLESEPELVNKSPYYQGWMIKIRMSDPAEIDRLMDSLSYEKYVEKEKK